jgi:branched-subunit amino acid aminotransferase/4-amino-4-deoxychorismate lyase
MQTLKAMGYTVAEGKVRVDALRDAKEVFLTSSLSGVRPVVRLDGRDIGNGKPGSCAARLGDKLTKVPRIATVAKGDR